MIKVRKNMITIFGKQYDVLGIREWSADKLFRNSAITFSISWVDPNGVEMSYCNETMTGDSLDVEADKDE